METKYTIADIEIKTSIPFQVIREMTITTLMGTHGILDVVLGVEDTVSPVDMERYQDSGISVSVTGEGIIFSGICTQVGLNNQHGTKSVHIIAKSHSYLLDREKKSETFQDPSKTLQQVANQVCGAYGASIFLDSDVTLPNVLSQENETAFEFIKRIAACQGKTVFTNVAMSTPELYIGKTGFRTYEESDIGDVVSSGRDVLEMAKTAGAGQAAEGFMFDETSCYCKKLGASAGDRIGTAQVIKKSVISNEKASFTNQITYAVEEGIRPATEEAIQPGFRKGVLTGTVMAVSGNDIQVQLDTDAGAGGMTWVPYESSLSNSFYCMPDEGDKVFLYYENNGNIVCLGSKHLSTDGEDFQKPSEKVMTNHDKMIKLGDAKITFTATRNLHDEENPNEISIYMEDESGITIQSGMDISMVAGENINLCAGNVENADALSKEGHEKLKARHEAGQQKYASESGDPKAIQVLGALASDFGKAVVTNAVDTAKGMLMVDMWKTLFSSDKKDGEGPENTITPVETGVMTLYGYESLVFVVQDSRIEIGTDIEFNTDSFKWLGYTQMQHAKEEIPLQDWWETALDGLQMALDIAGMIPGVGCIFDVASSVISLARGDFMGAAMSLVSAIPGIGDAVGAAKIAGKGIKMATKVLSKAERIMHVLQGIYMIAQGAWALYSSKDQLKDLWNRLQEGGLSAIANPADISLILNTASSAAMVLKGTKSVAEGAIGKKVTLEQGSKTDQETKCGDPINIATGSFSLAYTDLQLRDVRETFFLKRHHESVYKNEGMMLGDRWFLNIETRIIVDEPGKITVQLPDMRLLYFEYADGVWVNQKGEDRSYQLYDLAEGYELVCHENELTYRYSEEGRIVAITDRYRNRTLFEYEENRLSRMLLASGLSLSFVYENGFLRSITTDDGRRICYEYEGKLLNRVILSNDASIRYEYDSNGCVTAITDQNGCEYVRNEYDRKGRVVRQKTAQGHDFLFFYDTKEKRTIFTEASSGEKTVYYYDDRDIVTRREYEDGTVEEFGYDRWENCIYEKDRNGNEIHRVYDVYGKLLEETTAGGLITQNEYDRNHNRIRQTDNMGREVLWVYDSDGHLVEEKLLLENGKYAIMQFEYDDRGRIRAYHNPNGNQTHYRYEQFSEPVLKEGPEGETTTYTYDGAGRLLEERTPSGIIGYGYNRTDCMTMYQDEDGAITRYTYDWLGNPVGIQKPNQADNDKQQIRITYTKLDKIERIVTAEGNVHQYLYSPDGRVKKVIHPNAYQERGTKGEGVEYDYDITGRLIRIHYPDGGIKRFFPDGNGNIIKMVMPEQYDALTDDGAGYQYEYDAENRLTKVTDPAGNVQNVFCYDKAGYIVKSIDALGYRTADTDEERAGTLYRYNLAGWMLEKREPLDFMVSEAKATGYQYHLTTYRYDSMGLLISETRYVEPQTVDSASGKSHTISYRYDRSNRLTEILDSTGAAICYAYDQAGNRTLERVRVGEDTWRETRYEYSRAGKLLRRMIRLSDSQTEEDALNVMAEHRTSDYAVTEYHYDANGNLTQQKNPEGGIYEYFYDADDRLIEERHREPGGEIANILRYAYDAADNRIRITDVSGNTTEYCYDYQDRMTGSIRPDGGKTRTVYDRNGNIVRSYTPLQMAVLEEKNRENPEHPLNKMPCWCYTYDVCNHMVAITSPDGITRKHMAYDAAGNLIRNTDQAGSGIHLTYDLAGRRTMAVTSGGVSQKYTYDALGNNTALTDGMGNRTEFILDVWGRIIGVVKADGSRESYDYDYMGNMRKSTDGNGNSVNYRYDGRGNMLLRIDPSGARESFCYDREDRLVSHVDRNGNRMDISYNMYGSMTRRVAVRAGNEKAGEHGIGVVTESFGYLPDGRLRYAISNGMRYDYEYDCMNRLVRKSASGRTLLENAYDLNGNRILLRDISGKETRYGYDALDRMEHIADGGRELVTYRYNEDGTLKRMVTGGSIITEYTYDTDRNIVGQRTHVEDCQNPPEAVGGYQNLSQGALCGNSGVIVDNTYRYDELGNLSEKRTLSGLTRYAYDCVNRLVWSVNPMGMEEFTYDPAGNRLSRLWRSRGGEAGIRETCAYDSRNHLIQREVQVQQGGQDAFLRLHEYAYDKQGNLTEDRAWMAGSDSTPDTRSLHYDAMNRLSEVHSDRGVLQRNTYDAEGLRAEMEENGHLVQFLYDGDKVVVETDQAGGMQRFIRGHELVSSDCENARTYYHYACDELGSVTDVISPRGEVLNHYEYDAFGNFTVREEQVPNRFGFAGEQFDPATGLYYLRARFYNPVIGRFIQEDTYYGDGLNLYAYCHNNPVGYVDPSGHDACPHKTDSINYLEEKCGLTNDEATRLYEQLRTQEEYKTLSPKEFNDKLKNGDFDSRYQVIEFNNKDGKFDVDEYERQLLGQENGLNNMAASENAENRRLYDKQGRDPRSAKAQKDYRKMEIEQRANEIMAETGKNQVDAMKQAKEEFKGMAALHDPDQIAGGYYDHITGMGDSRINSSIGSQWKNKNAVTLSNYVARLPENANLVVLLVLRNSTK